MAENERHSLEFFNGCHQHDAPASGLAEHHSLARRASHSDSCLLVGLGSPHGDDQAGWLVASELQRRINVAASLPRGGATANRLLNSGEFPAAEVGRRQSMAIASPRGSEATTFTRSLRQRAPTESLACRLAKSPSDLLDWLDDVTHLIVCDSCESPTQLGELRRWHWPADRFVRTRSSSSHQLGLSDVLDLATNIGRLPPCVEIWAIGGGRFAPETEPSSLVRDACQRLVRQLSEGFARA